MDWRVVRGVLEKMLCGAVGVLKSNGQKSNLAVVQKHVRNAVLDGVLTTTVCAHQRTFHNVQLFPCGV